MGEEKNFVPNILLRHERERRNLTQQQVADEIATTALNVGRWERGEVFPSSYYRQKLCDFFGKSPEELGLIKERYKQTSFQRDKVKDETSKSTVYAAFTRRIAKHPRFSFGVVVMFLLLAVGSVGLFVYAFPLRPTRIKPGGAWISPRGQTVGDVIRFAAYAYPTHKGDPEIDHVNFTVFWQGVDPRRWIIACVARKPIRTIIFTCDANLRKLGTPAGQIIVSFDVYDRQGNMNLAPNGEHTLTYLLSDP